MDKYEIPNVKTFEYTKIINIENIDFGKYIIIDDFAFIYARKKIKLGDYVHIGIYASISGGEELKVGSYSAISQGVRILTATDDFKDWGFGNSTVDDKFRNVQSAPIEIGDFCIIGANSVVLPGVKIGNGAMVGANSVVTKDLESWGIYVGNRKIGERNKEEVLSNYKKFLETPENERIGNLFK